MVKGLLNDRQELEALFDELADELVQLGKRAEIVMVGGAWMLEHSQRMSTRDVDSTRRFDSDLSQAIDRVGFRHDLPKGGSMTLPLPSGRRPQVTTTAS